jgi:DNA relaxase NicK
MGVHVRCSGQACRQLEAEGLVRLDDGGWEAFLGLMRDTEASCARIDVASDDRRELVKPELVEAAITNVADAKEGLPVIVTRFRKAPQYVVTDLTTGKPSTGWSRYLGTGKSRIRVRMYDKRAESIEKGLADPGPWVRVEVQARDERADWLLKQIVADSGAAVAECLLNYVDFREVDPADSNRSRWVTCSWWVSFLATLEKRKSTCTGVVRSLEQTLQWLSRQVSPALAFVLHAPGFGLDALLSLLPEGTERLQPWHIKTLEAMGMKMGPDENPAETVPQLQDGQYFLGFESVDRIPVSVPSTPGLGFGLL